MRSFNNIQKLPLLAAALAVFSCGQIASADDTVIITTPVEVAPATVEIQPVEVVTPAVIAPADTVTQTRQTTISTSPATVTGESVEVMGYKNPVEVQRQRLAHQKIWISEGLSKGFLTPTEADNLLAEHSRLVSALSGVVQHSTVEEQRSMERQINAFHIAISHAMEGRSVAGMSQFQ